MSLVIRSRKASPLKSSRAVPTTAKAGGSRPSRWRLYRAGISRRLVRSPEAPKMTITHGLAGCLPSSGGAGKAICAVCMRAGPSLVDPAARPLVAGEAEGLAAQELVAGDGRADPL